MTMLGQLGQSFSRIFGDNTLAAPAVAATVIGDPTKTTTVAEPVVPPAPLDTFNTLWEPVKQPEGGDPTLPANIFAGTDPVKMLESARKVDFAKSIPPETLAKITAGGPEAGAAFLAAINDVSQRAYAQSSFAATKIVETALARFQDGLDTRLPSQIKKHSVSDAIRQSNPLLQHPAAAPIMQALEAQFTVKYPNATVAEIQGMASDYLTQFAGLALPKAPAAKVPESEDWGAFETKATRFGF